MKRSFSFAMRSPVIPIPSNLPIGFRFNPTDEELIGYYLEMLLHGLYSDDMPIGFVNLLEFEPWELPGRSRVNSHDDQVWYFFYQREFYGDKKRGMFKRKTPTGRWCPTGDSKIIENLGKKSTLRFYKDSPKQKTEWIAYEYEITKMPNPGEFVIIKLMISSGEKRTKMNTNTSKQNSQKTTTSANDGSPSPDELMTMSNCCSRGDIADFGNQNIANTTTTSTYSIPQEYIHKDTVCEVMDAISYGNYIVSSDYGHENPEEMTIMSTYDIGESSSQATSCYQNHSSVSVLQERGYFHPGVSPYTLENQEDCIMSSSFENQKRPSEVEDCPTKAIPCTENQFENRKLPSEIEDSPPKATPYTENQSTPDETNLSCSMTSRLEDHFQNQEFDLDEVLAEKDAFDELLSCLYPTVQQAACLDQCM